jgi:hypothetical protein
MKTRQPACGSKIKSMTALKYETAALNTYEHNGGVHSSNVCCFLHILAKALTGSSQTDAKYTHTPTHIPEEDAVLDVATSLHSQCTTTVSAASFATGTSQDNSYSFSHSLSCRQNNMAKS